MNKDTHKYIVQMTNLSNNARFLSLIKVDEYIKYDERRANLSDNEKNFVVLEAKVETGVYLRGNTVNQVESKKVYVKEQDCYTKEEAYKLFFDTLFSRW